MKNGLEQFKKAIETKVCSMCGATASDFWETAPAKIVVLKMRPRFGDSKTFWITCDECDEGLQNAAPPRPAQIHLLAQIRRATINDQEAVLKWLLQKFGLEAEKKGG